MKSQLSKSRLELLSAALTNPRTVERYQSLISTGTTAAGCRVWTGAISGKGQGRFWPHTPRRPRLRHDRPPLRLRTPSRHRAPGRRQRPSPHLRRTLLPKPRPLDARNHPRKHPRVVRTTTHHRVTPPRQTRSPRPRYRAPRSRPPGRRPRRRCSCRFSARRPTTGPPVWLDRRPIRSRCGALETSHRNGDSGRHRSCSSLRRLGGPHRQVHDRVGARS